MMSDHLFSVEILERVKRFPLEAGQVGLAVDERTDLIFDIDDATKVQTIGSQITSIGKSLAEYNAVDCGLFKCTHAIFDSLESIRARTGDCSLTDGCLQLAHHGQLRAISTENALWIDVDTPEALEQAERIFPHSGG
jgi:choline kinase